jgi:hypothetical protein
MTVASGSGDAVAEEGRKIPVAVFYIISHVPIYLYRKQKGLTYCLGLESLNEDSVKEGLEGLDVLESSGLSVSLTLLQSTSNLPL